MIIEKAEITFIPVGFLDFFPFLEDISISSTNLRVLHPDQFKSQPALKSVDLSRNKLTNLPPDIFKTLTKLKLLDLSSNLLDALPGEIFSGGSINVLYLHSNPMDKRPSLIRALNTKGLKNCRLVSIDYETSLVLPAEKLFETIPDSAEIIYWGRY